MKHIFSGLESSGKSYLLAKLVADIAWRNKKWYEKSKIIRPIYSNLKFSQKFYNLCVNEYKIPIFYWENIDDLIKIKHADIIIDEVGNYFDSRLWTELSLDTRRWLSQGAKVGIELYGTAQDFAQVDKAFRRLVNHLTHITKIIGSRRPSATKPPVGFIWGLCMKRDLDPIAYDEDKKRFEGSGMPAFFFLRREYCELFDTSQIIEKSKPMPYKHIARVCELSSCSFHQIRHV